MSNQLRVLVVDVETTSLDERAGSILQIGACWLIGGPEADEMQEFTVDCRAYPGALIETEALEWNGSTRERVWDPALPTEAEAIWSFGSWLCKCCGQSSPKVLLAGLNPYFDLRWLKAARKRAGEVERCPFPHRTLDLHTLAFASALLSADLEIPSRGLYTDEIYEFLGLPPEPRPHVAIQGARAEAEALRVLLGLPNSLDAYSVIP